jgi:hypothetical protein
MSGMNILINKQNSAGIQKLITRFSLIPIQKTVFFMSTGINQNCSLKKFLKQAVGLENLF